ncbi:5-formyltetrahydrofolate cyclo-ligase [Neisseria sp. 83E34]|uniref:5-formyltetrahydrofolate cyclo-ligase n=1 Tax=Neisseria sp. 83E34 TaxID=1692264 RepID=UPI0035153DC3
MMLHSKHEIRRRLRRARKSLSDRERRRATLAANRNMKKLLKRGKKMAAYWPVGSELVLDELIRSAFKRGVRVYLPYIEKRSLRLWFTPYHVGLAPERNRKGRLDIPQFSGRKVRAERMDIMLLPLVGVDEQGYRLGQGGGFYDASLARARFGKPLKIGAGFACQMVQTLPCEVHDMRLDGFVSENGIVWF